MRLSSPFVPLSPSWEWHILAKVIADLVTGTWTATLLPSAMFVPASVHLSGVLLHWKSRLAPAFHGVYHHRVQNYSHYIEAVASDVAATNTERAPTVPEPIT